MKHQIPPEVHFSDEEVKQIDEWNEKHDKECRILLNHKDEWLPAYGAIGGGRTYSFTPTSIGTIMIMKCCCGEEFLIDNHL